MRADPKQKSHIIHRPFCSSRPEEKLRQLHQSSQASQLGMSRTESGLQPQSSHPASQHRTRELHSKQHPIEGKGQITQDCGQSLPCTPTRKRTPETAKSASRQATWRVTGKAQPRVRWAEPTSTRRHERRRRPATRQRPTLELHKIPGT